MSVIPVYMKSDHVLSENSTVDIDKENSSAGSSLRDFEIKCYVKTKDSEVSYKQIFYLYIPCAIIRKFNVTRIFS